MKITKTWHILGFIGVGIIVLSIVGFFWYVSDYYQATTEALVSLESDEEVLVYEQGNLLIFEAITQIDETDKIARSDIGFILYPGGKVEHTVYAPIAKEIARAGYLTIIVEMPFNLAVFAPGRAQEAIEAFPDISKWAVGGHSLGGSMAARYSNKNQEHVDALILLASYADIDLSQTKLETLSIYGTQDGLISIEKIESTKELLPMTTVYVPIEGGNHAHFGMYGDQDKDLPASISVTEQHRIIIESTVGFLDSLVK